MAVLTGIAPQVLMDVDIETFNFMIQRLAERSDGG